VAGHVRSADFPVRSNVKNTKITEFFETVNFPGLLRTGKSALRLANRLLLRQAMERAEAQDQIDGVNSHHGSIFEQFGQRAEGDSIVRIIKRGNDHRPVGNVKIGIAGGQAAAAGTAARAWATG